MISNNIVYSDNMIEVIKKRDKDDMFCFLKKNSIIFNEDLKSHFDLKLKDY